MRLSEYVANYIADLGCKRVYSVCGAGSMYLSDALCHHPDLRVIATHGEQSATFAAEAESRLTGKIGVVSVTAGPGGTNTMTGVASAWVDSIPLLIIGGQVTSTTMIRDSGLRQLGTNELDMVSLMKPITKYAVTVTNPQAIKFHLEKAIYLATTGRSGPVWVEIPLNIQGMEIDEDDLLVFSPPPSRNYSRCSYTECIKLLNEAKRPVIIVGNGVRLASAAYEFMKLVDALSIPVLTSWNASDLIPTDHPCCIGRPGLCGDRAGNFTIQNADLILAIGTRLSIPQIGHNHKLFAREAKLIIVDIDETESNKETLRPFLKIITDAKYFIRGLLDNLHKIKIRPETMLWHHRCIDWKNKYPVMMDEYRHVKEGVNSYYFVEQLSKHLKDDAIIVTDVGAGFISPMQSMPMKQGQRMFHSGGVSSMGYGLPGAIGACFAGEGRQTICLTGDGGLMMNIQELQTVAHHKLPIKIFVFSNNGYLTMQATQNNFFKRESISSPQSGMSCPDFIRVADAFKIPTMRIKEQSHLTDVLGGIVNMKGPFLCELQMPAGQILAPRVLTRTDKNGKFIPTPIEDSFPYLTRDEFLSNMIVKPVEV